MVEKTLLKYAGLLKFMRAALYFSAVMALAYNLLLSWKLYSGQPLGDPAEYPALAKQQYFFYDSGCREPVPVFMAKFGLAAGLADDLSVRVPSLLLVLAGFAVFVYLVYALFGHAAAFCAGWCLGINPYLGFYAVHGASQISSGLLLALFVLFVLKGRQNAGKFNLTAVGLYAAASALARLESLIVIFAILAVDFLCGGARFKKERLTAAAVILALVSPYFIYQHAKFGHPFYSHMMHARFWRNVEKGVPPEQDRYAGGPLEAGSFIAEGGILKTGVKCVKGYARIFGGYVPKLLNYTAAKIAFIAGILAVAIAKEWVLLAALAGLFFPVSFIALLDQQYPGSGIEMRFMTHSLWLLCLFCGLGGKMLWDFLLTRAERKFANIKSSEWGLHAK